MPDDTTSSGSSLRLSARGLIVLGSGLLLLASGLAARYPAIVGLGAAMLATVLIALLGVLVAVPLEVTRSVRPARVVRHASCTARVTVTNRARWTALSVDGIDRVGGQDRPFRVSRLPAGASRETEVDVPTQRRGTIDFGPLVVRRTSWGELAGVDRRYGSFAQVVVEPRVHDALGLPAGSRRGHVGADERVAHGGTDLVGLREYIPGDDLRRLHWATSARYGTLMVREDADPSAPHLTVLLDDDPAAYVDDGFEEAVDVAASLLAVAAERGSPARLVTTSGRTELDCPPPAGLGAGLDPHVVDVLTHVELAPVPDASVRAELLDRALSAGSPDVLAVVTGSRAPLDPFVLEAERSATGVVLVLDPNPARLASAAGRVTVLRCPRAADVVQAWRTVLA